MHFQPHRTQAHLAHRAGQARRLWAGQQRIHAAAAVALDHVESKPAEEKLEHTQLQMGEARRCGAVGRGVDGC